jgi:hypothetical protein
MRLDSALKISRPQYISAQKISTLFDAKLPDNFQMCEHSWPCTCRFHITFTLCNVHDYALCIWSIFKYFLLFCSECTVISLSYGYSHQRSPLLLGHVSNQKQLSVKWQIYNIACELWTNYPIYRLHLLSPLINEIHATVLWDNKEGQTGHDIRSQTIINSTLTPH